MLDHSFVAKAREAGARQRVEVGDAMQPQSSKSHSIVVSLS